MFRLDLKCMTSPSLHTQLEAIKRVDQTEWDTDVILPSVSFAPLILPSAESVKDLQALEICKYNCRPAQSCGYFCKTWTKCVFLLFLFLAVEPHPLKSLCRLAILSYLTREYYDEIHKLPLPTHLKVTLQYTSSLIPSPPRGSLGMRLVVV